MSTRKAIGVSAHAAPIGWVHLRGGIHAPDGYTIRWRRGEPIAYMLAGKQLDSYAVTGAGVVTTVEVPSTGWIDMAHIRAHGQRWLATHPGKGAGR